MSCYTPAEVGDEEDDDECGQVWVEGWLGVDDFGVVVDGVVVDGVVSVGVVVVGVVGVELWVAAIAAPPPAVRPNTRAARRSVRFGLRMSPPFHGLRDVLRHQSHQPLQPSEEVL